jgi:alpha-galactosidase
MRKSCRIFRAIGVGGLALAGFLADSSISPARAQAASLSPEKTRSLHWISDHLTGETPQVPFSFVYDGQPSAQLLASWSRKVEKTQLDPNRIQDTITWTDPKTGLKVTCIAVEFTDFPALEWAVYFKNDGAVNTPILEEIEAIDTQLTAENPGGAHLHYIDGDGESHGQLQFAPQDKALVPATEIKFAPLDGRPTDGCFPYYNLDWNGQGVMVALGWPGQWASSFISDAQGNVHMTGGQETTHLCLQTAEQIRTPRMAMLFWSGDNWIDGQNSWRHWMRAHNMPKPGGHDVPVIRAGGGFMYDKLGWGERLLNEKDQTTLIDRYHEERIRLNTWWIDILGAGTFTSYTDKYITQPAQTVVSWDTDLKRFPHGLRAISDHARTFDEKLLVWIEPEHVWSPNILFRDHPDWLLDAPDDPAIKKQINQGVVLGNRQLLNLGNPAACQWIIDRLSKLIDDEDIEIYRQDFNITPLLFWRQHDAPDRQGMTENLYVQGYLRLLDTLQARHPNMLIDTCASGGRRDDLETLRRAVPLWRSDQWGPDVVQQTQTYGLALWVPYFGTGTHVTDKYAYRSSLGSSLMTSWDVRDPKLDYAALRKLEAEFWQAAPFFREDYYPLSPFNADANAWLAWQFNRSEQGDGLIQVFRRNKADETSKIFPLHALDPAVQYEITNLDTQVSSTASGKDLMEKGLTIPIQDTPGAVVLIYHRAK